MSPPNRVPPRRAVAFAHLDAFTADAQRLARANAATSGAWSLAQILEHLAIAIEYQLDGFPPPLHLPRLAKLLLRIFLKKRILTRGMSPGFRLKPAAAPLLVPAAEGLALEASLEHLKRAVGRLQAAARFADHPAFGPMTKEEATALHLRHAELHMSFVVEPAAADSPR